MTPPQTRSSPIRLASSVAASRAIREWRLTARLNRSIDLIPDEAMEVLKAHDWPGNIRELQNFIERAVVFSPESVLRLPLTDLKLMTKQPSAAASRTLADAEREHILDVLKQTDGLIGGMHG